MLKLLTGEWLAAEAENKEIRDRLRSAFWEDCGVTPAKNSSEIDIPAGQRLSSMAALVDRTVNGPLGDAEIGAVSALAGTSVAQLGLGSFSHGLSLAPDMLAMAPKALRQFFVAEDRTSYEWSESGEAS